MRTGLTDEAAAVAIDVATRTLHLPTVRSSAVEFATAAVRDRLTHLGYLAELLSVEVEDREARRRERRIAEEQVAAEGKPEQVRAKIVEGKIKKFIAERTLLEQPFVRDDKVTVGDMIKEASGKLGEAVTVRRFARFQVGAG